MASICEETYCPLGYWHPVLATQPLVKYVIICKGQILGYTTFEAAAADLAAHPGTICSVENPQTSNKIVAATRCEQSAPIDDDDLTQCSECGWEGHHEDTHDCEPATPADEEDDAKSSNSSTYGEGCRRICRFCKEECSCWNYNSDHEVVCEDCGGCEEEEENDNGRACQRCGRTTCPSDDAYPFRLLWNSNKTGKEICRCCVAVEDNEDS